MCSTNKTLKSKKKLKGNISPYLNGKKDVKINEACSTWDDDRKRYFSHLGRLDFSGSALAEVLLLSSFAESRRLLEGSNTSFPVCIVSSDVAAMLFPTEASVGGGVSRERILVTVISLVFPEKLCSVTLTQNLCVCPMVLIRASGTGTSWSGPSFLLALHSSTIVWV